VNCYELTSKFTLAETGRNLFLPDRFKPRFKPPSAETCQPWDTVVWQRGCDPLDWRTASWELQQLQQAIMEQNVLEGGGFAHLYH